MPTGITLHAARDQLLDAAGRVLHRDGPGGLTSRAITAEAGCAKGVLHRHFADRDTFLTEMVLDRIAQLDSQAAGLRESAGTGTVSGNLAAVLTEVFDPVALGILGLVSSRHELLARLRETTPSGIPVLTEAAAMIASYLKSEQKLGRVAPHAETDTLAPILIGAAHLLFASEQPTSPEPDAIHNVVSTVIASVVQEPRQNGGPASTRKPPR